MEDPLGRALERLLVAADAGRVYVFENFQDPEDGLCMRQTREVVAKGVTPEIDNPLLQRLPYEHSGFGRWAETLAQGAHIGGVVETFPREERAVLEQRGILSVLILPIEVNGKWHGFVGFDELRAPRDWSPEEVQLLRVGSELVGNFIGRQQVEQELARHRNHLEELVNQRSQELRESQEKLRQAEKLASVGTFAAGIAHEINNPVGSMVLAAEYALRIHDRPGGTQEVLNSLADIIRDGRRCREIVQSVLRFSRRDPTEKCISDLNHIVRRGVEVALLAYPEFSAIKYELAEGLPPVELNPTRIEQVIANLVRNSIESGDAQGKVSVRTTKSPRGVAVVVTDDGRGMTQEQCRQAFDPFFTTRLNQGGTGLGLSISHGIVSEHGGVIDITSTRGRGTVVTVELPA